MISIRFILVMALAAFVSACATTKHPIGVSGGPQTDARLLGGWKGVDKETGNPVYMFFLPRAGAYDMEVVAVIPAGKDEKGSWENYSVVSGKAGAHRFLNGRPLMRNGRPYDAPADEYTPILYRIESDGVLHFATPDIDAIKLAVQTHALAGEVKGESVVITAEPAALDAYIAAHAATLFKQSDVVLRRVE